jgi:aminoglycoside phosphotransferase (APT) family kinase protein
VPTISPGLARRLVDSQLKEATWLPRLAPHLPLAVPAPVGVGRPDFGYPWPWAVSRWLPGSVATVAIADLAGVFDAGALLRVWEEALGAPAWDRPPVWFHGDFHTGNLLAVDGKLTAVIDFGGLGVGDPASDLQIAYTLLDAAPRAAFRAALGLDDAAWARGRGRALTGGLIAYRAYAASDERVAAQTTRQITAAASESAPASPH